MNINNNYTKNPFVSNFDTISDAKKALNTNDTTNKTENGQSFFDILSNKLNEVNDKQIEADTATQNYIKGDETDIHNVMISTEEAKMSLEMAVQVRNKIVEAYQEISRMQL